uniref:Calcineurin-like phosphoesterase n=1 Tax=Candidatus Kentrum sp. LFY TaxID=2126342 RepID=A0A450UEB3_9GAMM|nr:MAG: Calcineurin-like phosphoesterase [Candidatus Kentron sp. LFY]
MRHPREDYNRRVPCVDGSIPENEPVFLLRGQDRFAADALRAYAELVGDASPRVTKMAREWAYEIDQWPRKKTPDLPDPSRQAIDPAHGGKTLLHISDLHIGRDGDSETVVERLLAHLEKDYPDAHLFVTGDLTHSGGIHQYDRVAELLWPFRGRISMAPGNHDYAVDGRSIFFSKKSMHRFEEILTRPFGLQGSYLDRNAPVMADHVDDGFLSIGIDSNLETIDPFDFSRGRVEEPQISLMRQELNNPCYDGHFKVVYLHHRPYPFTGIREKIAGLDGKEDFLDAARGADLVLYGHGHCAEKFVDEGKTGLMVAAPPAFEGRYVEIVVDGRATDAKFHIIPGA